MSVIMARNLLMPNLGGTANYPSDNSHRYYGDPFFETGRPAPKGGE
jgi:hypothetical protein